MTKPTKRRMTSQRRIILEELRKVKTHPTADELYDMTRRRLPKISLGTIYRNLEQMAEAGEILKLEMCGCQKRFDGKIEPHNHIRCSFCGKVADVEADLSLPSLESCKVEGFSVTGYYLEVVGVCHQCKVKDHPVSTA
ncbi:MAG: transcriptional repressor [Desulfovibrionales bacterium]